MYPLVTYSYLFIQHFNMQQQNNKNNNNNFNCNNNKERTERLINSVLDRRQREIRIRNSVKREELKS